MSSRKRNPVADRIVYVIARVAIGTAARVPQWLGYRLANGLGRLWFCVDRRRRGYARKFLQQAYPDLSDREHMRMGSRATGNLFMIPLDMARLTRLIARGGRLEEVIDFGNAAQKFATAGAPCLGFSAHLGSWEVAAVAVAQLVGHAHGSARVTRNPLLNDWILANRERGGLTIHARRGGFKDLTRALEGGGVGLQVVDQNQRLRGVFAPVFGRLASCERAAASLALRHGYPLISGTALRRGLRFRFDLVIGDPFVPERSGDKQADLVAAVSRVNEELEKLIRMAPDQYLWIHDRYRTQPDEEQRADVTSKGDDDSES